MLPRRILEALTEPRTVDELANDLQINDARVLWHLERLAATGHVVGGERWQRTDVPVPDEAEPGPVTLVPEASVHDFVQAFADAEAGMFGSDYVQAGEEHASRMSTEQAAEFRDRLMALIAEYFAPGAGDRSGTKYGFRWVLTPVDLHPLRD
ncbi:winged helix-turn-helix domain-containing protein [Tenggerimyces flavus]|uniref:Winged helix-turn-helix domain-containing protein n=1 Tax=Tenggerimyces flavus TaxID=1708749 RepID=A0ABV7YFP7_9ACTN|nr:winged helix-turn-helix domain-containing protein [Tenggerimyces flavus]MBM7783950.1 DNA-binding transcriptional MocR family regulator [Tenggerimyces flavus]